MHFPSYFWLSCVLTKGLKRGANRKKNVHFALRPLSHSFVSTVGKNIWFCSSARSGESSFLCLDNPTTAWHFTAGCISAAGSFLTRRFCVISRRCRYLISRRLFCAHKMNFAHKVACGINSPLRHRSSANAGVAAFPWKPNRIRQPKPPNRCTAPPAVISNEPSELLPFASCRGAAGVGGEQKRSPWIWGRRLLSAFAALGSRLRSPTKWL